MAEHVFMRHPFSIAGFVKMLCNVFDSIGRGIFMDALEEGRALNEGVKCQVGM